MYPVQNIEKIQKFKDQNYKKKQKSLSPGPWGSGWMGEGDVDPNVASS